MEVLSKALNASHSPFSVCVGLDQYCPRSPAAVMGIMFEVYTITLGAVFFILALLYTQSFAGVLQESSWRLPQTLPGRVFGLGSLGSICMMVSMANYAIARYPLMSLHLIPDWLGTMFIISQCVMYVHSYHARFAGIQGMASKLADWVMFFVFWGGSCAGTMAQIFAPEYYGISRAFKLFCYALPLASAGFESFWALIIIFRRTTAPLKRSGLFHLIGALAGVSLGAVVMVYGGASTIYEPIALPTEVFGILTILDLVRAGLLILVFLAARKSNSSAPLDLSTVTPVAQKQLHVDTPRYWWRNVLGSAALVVLVYIAGFWGIVVPAEYWHTVVLGAALVPLALWKLCVILVTSSERLDGKAVAVAVGWRMRSRPVYIARVAFTAFQILLSVYYFLSVAFVPVYRWPSNVSVWTLGLNVKLWPFTVDRWTTLLIVVVLYGVSDIVLTCLRIIKVHSSVPVIMRYVSAMLFDWFIMTAYSIVIYSISCPGGKLAINLSLSCTTHSSPRVAVGLLLVFGSLLVVCFADIYVSFVKSARTPLDSYVPMFGILQSTGKLMLVIVVNTSWPAAGIGICTVIILVTLLAIQVYMQPCLGPGRVINCVKTAGFAISLFAVSCALLNEAVVDSTPLLGVGVFGIGLVPVGGLAFAMNWLRATRFDRDSQVKAVLHGHWAGAENFTAAFANYPSCREDLRADLTSPDHPTVSGALVRVQHLVRTQYGISLFWGSGMLPALVDVLHSRPVEVSSILLELLMVGGPIYVQLFQDHHVMEQLLGLAMHPPQGMPADWADDVDALIATLKKGREFIVRCIALQPTAYFSLQPNASAADMSGITVPKVANKDACAFLIHEEVPLSRSVDGFIVYIHSIPESAGGQTRLMQELLLALPGVEPAGGLSIVLGYGKLEQDSRIGSSDLLGASVDTEALQDVLSSRDLEIPPSASSRLNLSIRRPSGKSMTGSRTKNLPAGLATPSSLFANPTNEQTAWQTFIKTVQEKVPSWCKIYYVSSPCGTVLGRPLQLLSARMLHVLCRRLATQELATFASLGRSMKWASAASFRLRQSSVEPAPRTCCLCFKCFDNHEQERLVAVAHVSTRRALVGSPGLTAAPPMMFKNAVTREAPMPVLAFMSSGNIPTETA